MADLVEHRHNIVLTAPDRTEAALDTEPDRTAAGERHLAADLAVVGWHNRNRPVPVQRQPALLELIAVVGSRPDKAVRLEDSLAQAPDCTVVAAKVVRIPAAARLAAIAEVRAVDKSQKIRRRPVQWLTLARRYLRHSATTDLFS